jgi:hypothetical protein
MKMLERVVLSEEMERKKAAKKLMTKEEKISYVTKWKKKNRLMLIEGGVWPPRGGDQAVVNPLKFLSGYIFCIIKCTENGPPSSDGISSVILMLWYYCKWQYISSCIWNSFWE